MHYLIVLFVIVTSGCASYFKRQECNKINWFEHGYRVAMEGKRVDADSKLQECKKVEADIHWGQIDQGFKSGMANYCKPEIVLATGKKGEFFNPDMCDSGKVPFLKDQHSKGVQHFCRKENGFSFGASGSKYNHICSRQLEVAFLPEYRRGRRSYLQIKIRKIWSEIKEIEIQIKHEKSSKISAQSRLRRHRSREPRKSVRKYNRLSEKYEDASNPAHEVWREMERDLQIESQEISSSIYRMEQKVKTLKKERNDFETEANSLR